MHDIAIIGGGPVGLSAALALQHTAGKIAIIESGDLRAVASEGFNARSLALSTSSVQIFRALGIWQKIAAQATAIRLIHISARGRWGVTRLRASDHGLDALGYVIESQALTRCLLDAVDASPRIELIETAECGEIDQADRVRIGYRSGDQQAQLEARLALIADGANSTTRDRLGIGHQDIDYAQTAVICNLEVGKAQDAIAYERFTPQGPLAMLPLGGRRYACVWTLSPARAEQIAAATDDDCCAALQDCFGYRLGLIERVGARFALPLRRTRADRLYRDRCLLIGNAANALHPVAGQSFNLSLRDIASLYELLVEISPVQMDEITVARLADDYASQRLAEQRRVIRYGDGLVSLFSNRLPLFEQARAASLGLLDLVPLLKSQVALSGMGLTFGGNRLLRGHL